MGRFELETRFDFLASFEFLLAFIDFFLASLELETRLFLQRSLHRGRVSKVAYPGGFLRALESFHGCLSWVFLELLRVSKVAYPGFF